MLLELNTEKRTRIFPRKWREIFFLLLGYEVMIVFESNSDDYRNERHKEQKKTDQKTEIWEVEVSINGKKILN